MWNNKLKAVTFSFDDGILQDKKAIEILDKYHLKATFNINSSLLGLKEAINRNNLEVRLDRVLPSDVKQTYKNHEVYLHTLTHPNLTTLDKDTIAYQINQDANQIEKLVGYKIKGMAYPCGGINYDNKVLDVIKNNTDIKFARTIISSYSFDLQLDNLIEFKPTVYQIEDCLFDIIDKFLNLKTDKPQLLYIWGHTFEMDANYISWENFEKMCKLLANHDDIYYGTNSEVLMLDK